MATIVTISMCMDKCTCKENYSGNRKCRTTPERATAAIVTGHQNWTINLTPNDAQGSGSAKVLRVSYSTIPIGKCDQNASSTAHQIMRPGCMLNEFTRIPMSRPYM